MSIFANCSQHFPNESEFENCTLTTAPCKLIKDLNSVINVATIAFYVCTAFFSTAALANVYCLCVTLPIFFRLKEESRKRYIFLVTRCISAILTVVSMLTVTWLFSNTLSRTPSSFFLYAVVLIISNTNTFGLLGSYAGLAMLLYIGVIYPMFFQSVITVRFIYALVFVIYCLALAVSIPFALFQAAVIDPAVIHCDIKTCAPLMNLIEFIIMCICLVFTISVLFFVLISLIRHARRLKRVNTLSSSTSSMNRIRSRLACTLLVVIFISTAELIPFAFLLKMSFRSDTFQHCSDFYQSNRLLEEALAGFTEFIIWSIIMIVDPLVNIFCDKKVSERVKQQFQWVRWRLSSCRSFPAPPLI